MSIILLLKKKGKYVLIFLRFFDSDDEFYGNDRVLADEILQLVEDNSVNISTIQQLDEVIDYYASEEYIRGVEFFALYKYICLYLIKEEVKDFILVLNYMDALLHNKFIYDGNSNKTKDEMSAQFIEFIKKILKCENSVEEYRRDFEKIFEI